MGGIAITILLALSEKFQEGADERMARAVLVSETRHGGPVPDERRVEDFVCCEVPIGEDTAMALEVFTSRERAEAELRGMERLAPGAYYPRPANKHRVRSTSGEPDKTLSDRVDEFVRYELIEMLDGSGIPYVLVDPPPIDEPIPEGLRIEPTPVFAEGLGQPLLGEMKKGRA